MDAGIVGALLTLAGLAVVNIGVMLYKFGRLDQKVEDFCKRVDRLERNDNGRQDIQKYKDRS